MSLAATFTLAVIVAMVGVLAFTRQPADGVFLAGLTAFLATGIVSPAEAFVGFSNPGVMTVGLLYVVVAGLKESGAVERLGFVLFGAPRSAREAQRRLLPFSTLISAFLNNTPVVAVLIPVVNDWSRKYRIPASKLLIPLSYAAILGGSCTLIGTSTNLVVNGLLMDETGGTGLGLFEIARVGVPVAIVGIVLVLVVVPRFLPDRRTPMLALEDAREYTVEMVVERGSPLVARTIEGAGLRHLTGVFLADIERGGRLLPAVPPSEVLQAGDRLVFVGVVDSIVDLQRMPGLVPATSEVLELQVPRAQRQILEAVVSDTSRLVGRSIREARFRTEYNAVVIAVARNGERIRAKVGDIVLRPGDTLLLEAASGFYDRYRNSREFWLVSVVSGTATPRHDRVLPAFGVLGAMVVLAGTGVVPVLTAVLLAAAGMVALRCTSVAAARQTVDLPVLVTIAAAIGVGSALEVSGGADVLAGLVEAVGGSNPWVDLALVYGLTALLTLVITNNAAAVLSFPIAATLANDLNASVVPFAVAVMIAASASFATPFSYQTNLMVQGPGGYRFGDYVRTGVPLNIVTAFVAIILIPRIWPF